MDSTQRVIDITERLAVRNYERYPVVFTEGRGVWIEDINGNSYLDMAAGYGLHNWGHSNPRWIKAIKRQVGKFIGASGNYYYPLHAEILEALNKLTGKEKALFSCEGAISVDASIKIARKWGYVVKGIEEGRAEIISTDKNFHGRTLGAVGMSPVDQYKNGFGPFPPGLETKVPFGDSEAFERAITKNTVAFFVEIIAGEGGIHIPPVGYFKEVERICRKHNVLLVDDEIQSGLGRTGYDLAYQCEGINPDIIILGKALGAGVPFSVVLGDDHIMNVIGPGDHGSTYGAYALGCAAGLASLSILQDWNLSENSREMGNYLMSGLKSIDSKYIKEIRGRGLFIGMELTCDINHSVCEMLLKEGLACLTARDNVVRFSPPLVINRVEIDLAINMLEKGFRKLEAR